MSDIKIGDKVVGIKGATRVAGTVMNIKEGHVHIKAPVSGVYAPVVSIVPMHKVTKLGEGAMKRKSEDEDHSGMDDYMAHKAEEEKKKKAKKEVKEDSHNKTHAIHVNGQEVAAHSSGPHAQNVAIKLKGLVGNRVSVHKMGEDVEQVEEGIVSGVKNFIKKYKNYRDAMKNGRPQIDYREDPVKAAAASKKFFEDSEQIDELSAGKKLGAAAVRLGKGAAAAAIHVASTPLAGLAGFPGKNVVRKVGDASLKLHNKAYDAAKNHLGKGVKHLGALEESHSIVNNLKADGKHEEAGAAAFKHGLGRKYGQHFGLRSTKDKDEASFHRGYDKAEIKSKQINEKSMYKNQAVKMTAHTEKDGKVYKGTHTVILKKVPTLDTPTIQAKTKERAEKSLKAHLKSRGHTVTGIEHLGEAPNYRTHGSYDRSSNDVFDRARRGFKSREHEHEAAVEAQHTAEREARESEPHHVYINHKVMRDKVAGTPVNFNGKKHAKAVAAKLVAKYPNMQVHTVHHSYTEKNGGVIPKANT